MILDRFKVDGQVAVITGAGRGIGAASAVALRPRSTGQSLTPLSRSGT